MKASIEVTSRNEAEVIRAGLNDPATRATVVIMGALAILPNDRVRERVLQYVRAMFDDERDQQS